MATASTSDAKQLLEAAYGTCQAVRSDGLGRTFRPLVHDDDLAHARVQIEEVGELATELSHANYSD